MASNSLQFMKCKIYEKNSIEDLIEKIFLEAEDEEEKFILDEIDNYIVDGFYITYNNSKELIFNQDTQSLEMKMIRKNVVIPFSIDIEKDTLDIWGNGNNAGRLVTRLGVLLNHKVEFEPLTIDLSRVATKLENMNIKVGNIKIDNYPIEKGIIAKCSFDVRYYSEPFKIINKYADDLVQITIILSASEYENITMIMYRSGSVVIYKAKEEISKENLDKIREICIG